MPVHTIRRIGRARSRILRYWFSQSLRLISTTEVSVRWIGLAAPPIIVVHGGAWSISDDSVTSHLREVANPLNDELNVLSPEGSALDAVEKAVAVMGDDDLRRWMRKLSTQTKMVGCNWIPFAEPQKA